MRISGFHIDGFGIYHSQGISHLPPGLILFLGNNECGKTTLMEFIRTMLFGFPGVREKRNNYQPLRGGKHGGRLHLLMQDGQSLMVARTPRQATISVEGGAPQAAELAEHFLGGLDRKTFEHIFAVGLTELQGLNVLTEDGVRRRLFAAGAGLGAESLPAAWQTLENELSGLLRRRGRKQIINQLVNQIHQTETQMRRLQGLAPAYAQAQERKARLEGQIRENQLQAQRRRQELRRLEQLEQARPSWVGLNQAREKAATLKFAEHFPADGLKRFDNLQDNLESTKQSLKARQDQAARLELELQNLQVDRLVLDHQEDIAALLGEREKLASALNDYPLIKTATEQAEAEFQRRLQELGPDWDSTRLARLDTSVAVRQQVQELGRYLGVAERQHHQQQTLKQSRVEAAAEAQKLAEETQARLNELPEPLLSEVQVQEQQQAVRRLRPLWGQRDLATTELNARLAVQEEATARRESLLRQLETPAVILPWWLLLAVLLAGLGLAAWLAVERFYLPAVLAGSTGAAIGAWLLVLRQRQQKFNRRHLAQLQADLETTKHRLEALATEIQHLEAQINNIDTELADEAQKAGIDRLADLVQLERRAAELESMAGNWREWQERQRQYQEAQGHWQRARDKLKDAEQEAANAAQVWEARQAEWQDWLAQRDLAMTMRPEGFEAVLQAVERARAAERALKEYQQRQGQMVSYINSARQRLSAVITACGRQPLGTEVGVEDLESLRRALEAARAVQQEQQQLEGQLAELQAELARLKEQQHAQEMARQALLQQAQAHDEDDFRRLANDYQDWCTAWRQIEDNQLALATIAGTPQAQVRLEKELSQSDPLQLQTEKEQIQAVLQELEAALAQDLQELGGLNRALDEMAGNEELGDMLLQHRSLQEQLADASRRWATLVVCHHLLDQARSIYERERQPLVIQEAGRFLGIMTRNRYRLVCAADQGSLRLEDKSLHRKEPLDWSSGLADQVYLAIRLGLAREFGRHSEPLPVILDEVLVKFDPSRQLGAAQVLLEFAQEQQVLLFSCHPHLKAIMQQAQQKYRPDIPRVAYYSISDGLIAALEPYS
ncbi:MAG: hypothetical protein BZ151_03515 [Desulfobacca sp. 4484_104]|nr:MAG: hypothetical protein BZ151_03515 [Desulfobacca sp. 4484_104]